MIETKNERETASLTREEVLKKHRQYLLPSVTNLYKDPLIATKGQGAVVTDLEGKNYLDFFGGILTISVGHANEEVNGAVIAQLNRIGHLTTLYPTIPIVTLAEKLANISPGELQKCFFTASGTEADETAVMLAQAHTGSSEIVALRHGYSGRSLLAQSLTAHSSWRALPTQVGAVKHGLAPYCYRCPLKQTYPKCGVACATDLEEMIATTTTGKVAGMLVEPIQGVGGFITPPKEYFQIAAEIIRRRGGVFISDEVQTGFGRTGKMWGIQQYGVEPDMMTMAKGIANGLPLGAVIATPAIADSFTKKTLSTFGGNPVSSAAANAVIDIIERDRLADNAARMGALLRDGLEQVQRRYPKHLGDVRGMGLMQAMELVADETIGDRTPAPEIVGRLMEETRKRGLLLGVGGLYGNVFRVAPPLNINEDQIRQALVILDESFAALTA